MAQKALLTVVTKVLGKGITDMLEQQKRWGEWIDPDNYEGEKSKAHKAADAALFKNMDKQTMKDWYPEEFAAQYPDEVDDEVINNDPIATAGVLTATQDAISPEEMAKIYGWDNINYRGGGPKQYRF
jgi:nitrate reductase beta subunit